MTSIAVAHDDTETLGQFATGLPDVEVRHSVENTCHFRELVDVGTSRCAETTGSLDDDGSEVLKDVVADGGRILCTLAILAAGGRATTNEGGVVKHILGTGWTCDVDVKIGRFAVDGDTSIRDDSLVGSRIGQTILMVDCDMMLEDGFEEVGDLVADEVVLVDAGAAGDLARQGMERVVDG